MATIISILQERIDQKKARLEEYQDKLQAEIDLVANLAENTRTMIGSSSSAAQRRRGMMTVSLDENIKQHREIIESIELAINECNAEVELLEKQKNDMEEKSG